MSSTRLTHCIAVLAFLFCVSLSAEPLTNNDSTHIHIEQAPEWSIQRELELENNIPIEQVSKGIFYQVVEVQVRVAPDGQRSRYSRFAETIVNQTGLDSSSQINISFDPSYQKVALNSLFIVRDDQRLDRLLTAKKSILHTESELESQIYNEQLTLNILIPDLKVGDTVVYSYTHFGANPVYRDSFAYGRNLTWSVPVKNQFLRVLWGKSNPLYVTTNNIEIAVQEKQTEDFIEYTVELNQAEDIDTPSQMPNWYDPYASIYFSESETWESVRDWASPFYQFESISPEIQSIANNIIDQHAEPEKQIVAALKYAQDNVRYVGLEMGLNSHLPTSPSETLLLGYGDCKDKTTLLISILKALKIESYPALVDTEDTKQILQKPPASNLFDHVIVTLELDGNRYWLDPTLTHQTGPLENLYQPDYGHALVLAEGEKALTSMASPTQSSYTNIEERYYIPAKNEDLVRFEVETEYAGSDGISILRRIERDSISTLSEDYKVYYQNIFPGLTVEEDLQIDTNNESGTTTVKEHYSIDKFWTLGEEHYEVDFYPSDIRSAVFKPEQAVRNAPLAFSYPNNIQNHFILEFESDGWEFDNEEVVEDNAFFWFRRKVSFSENTLTLAFDFQSKTDHIGEDKIDAYLEARDKLRKEAYYGILKYVKAENQSEPIPTTETNIIDVLSWELLTVIAYICCFIYIILSWRLESRKRPSFNNTCFYPISLVKFFALSACTFGAYKAYWMYRNWKAIKETKSREIMPIIRGIFAPIWFYSLFLELREDSVSRYTNNKVLPSLVALIFAAAYIALYVTTALLDDWTAVASSISTALLFIPLIKYINSINSEESDSYDYNSSWKLRHSLSVITLLPLLIYTFAAETPLMPDTAVVTQSQLMDRDLKFLYRNEIVPANEKIHYFYSDGFLSIREDGNGFTDNRVFSYWVNEDGSFESDVATYDEIKNIEVEYGSSEFSDTVITITKHDDSEFILFASTEDEKDKLFLRELSDLWKAQLK